MQKYHLLSLKWSKGNHYVWWGPNNNGYTTDLEKAGIYTKEQINSNQPYYRNTSTMPVPVELVNQGVQQRVSVADHDNYKLFGIGEYLKTAIEY